jgi:hypothetical protein
VIGRIMLVLTSSPSPTPIPGGPVDASRVTPGLLGALSFLFLVGAAIVLFRSLNKQLRRVPDSFGDQPPTP